MNSSVANLWAGQVTITKQDFFLWIEGLDHNADWELNEKDAEDDNQKYHDWNVEQIVILLRLVHWSHGIYGPKHDTNPALCRLNRQKCEHTINGGVEIKVWGGPFAAIVYAIPHCLDIVDLLSFV